MKYSSNGIVVPDPHHISRYNGNASWNGILRIIMTSCETFRSNILSVKSMGI